MAPTKPAPVIAEHTIDRTPEYEDFINKLREFHNERGTKFDAEPKVGNAHIDLLKVFNHVVENGGYDKITEEKLLWRKVSQDLGIYSHNVGAVAFSLKTVYYKNLAAYEIKTIHNKTPPPPEILEEVSAKGGNLLTRTLDNYRHRDRSTAQNSPQPSGDDGTPARETKPEGTPSSGRAARGLRHDPPQRVIFQPDTGPTRPSRHSSAQHNSNTSAAHSQTAQAPAALSHSQSNGHLPHSLSRTSTHHLSHGEVGQSHLARSGASLNFAPQNYEYQSMTVANSVAPTWPPKAQPTRPVETPANAPAKFLKKQPMPVSTLPRQAPLPSSVLIQPSPFDGPNIYARCLCALRSGLPEEEAFAVHHLMKISYERGDRYKFEGFPGLAEGLVHAAIQVGELFYNIKWTVCYNPDSDGDKFEELDGINGTSDILERISLLTPQSPQDHIQPSAFADRMVIVTEAAMAIRNMVMLPENSNYMAQFAPLRDLLCIILHLPTSESNVELKHIALDIAEQLTPALILGPLDPLYRMLLVQLHSTDRGCILTSLRALARISMNLSETNRLGAIPLHTLEMIIDWLMLNDDEMVDACLDFLYQYTAVVANLEKLLEFRHSKLVLPESLVKHLARLLSHGARRVTHTQTLEPEVKIPYSEEVATLPDDLLERLLAMEEPERCYMWLRSLFEEDAEASITQIAIWTAYQSSFSSRVTQLGKAMISPADFIRNVNHVWTTAGAQIIRGPKGENQKFIIKGIRARSRPVDPENEGKEYSRCLWTLSDPEHQKCNHWYADARKMFMHIINVHLGAPSLEEAQRIPEGLEAKCLWADCTKFRTPTRMRPDAFVNHIKTHLMAVEQVLEPSNGSHSVNNDTESTSAPTVSSPGEHSVKRTKRAHTVPAKSYFLTNEETLTARDERNPNIIQPAGIPLSAVLVLRNIARNVVKTESQDELLKEQERDGVDERARGWNERLFRPVLARLHDVMTANRVMAPNICSLLELITEQ